MAFDATDFVTEPAIPVKESEVLRTLREARARIADERNWTKYTLEDVGPDGQRRFCALGALLGGARSASSAAGRAMRATPALARALPSLYRRSAGANAIPRYNNTHTHKDVLALFDRAIAMEEASAV